MFSPYIRLLSGKKFHFLNPKKTDFLIEDIAFSLSMEGRYGNQCPFHYSVAQHSVLVSRMLPDEFKLEGLFHDASEAYILDIPKPFKKYLGLIYTSVEDKIQEKIFHKFNVNCTTESLLEVKKVDWRMYCTEVANLLPNRPKKEKKDAYKLTIKPWSAKRAFKEFTNEYSRITGNRIEIHDYIPSDFQRR